MNDFLEKLKADFKEIWRRLKISYAKLVGRQVSADGSIVNKTSTSTYEINLVPEVKAQMIKAQRMRNLVLFICIVVSSVALGAVVILFGVKSGQDIVMYNQDKNLARLSEKMNSYSELDDLLTIQAQLLHINEIIDQKTVLSRVFGALGVMLPSNEDVVKLSELRVNLESNTISMEGQADAKVSPLIDYRVLESFKKSVALTKYDYGRYVDADGEVIPTQCIREADAEGNAYRIGDSYYAWWELTTPGCEGALRGLTIESSEAKYHYTSSAYVQEGEVGKEPPSELYCDNTGKCKSDDPLENNPNDPMAGIDYPGNQESQNNENNEDGEGSENTGNNSSVRVPLRVMIWRTPQFNRWYTDGLMQSNGSISGIEHFESECYVYKGTPLDGAMRWTSTNDCMFAPNGLTNIDSANGRDESDNLVLRFSANLKVAEEFFMYQNKHMIAIGPMGQNVTDSYVQIGGMFTQSATPCEADDTECLSNKNNSGGN